VQPGDRIGERYVVERELGAGAAGRVFRCLDTRTETPVALKFLSAASVGAAAIERAGLLMLEHPALVRMLDSGSHGAQAYVVSEFVPGGSLTALRKPFPPGDLQQLAAQLLGALAFLHGQGILHADVKTENVFVASADPPVFKLGDFGLSRRIKDLRAGETAGSPAFMPPEVIRGEPIDERSDLYALGIVLYECAFGRLPFQGATVSAVFLGHLNQEPEGLRSPGAVPAREVALLRRLLAKDPAARPRDARAALAAWRGEEAAVPESALPRLGVLIGREMELAACERALSGPERVVILEGPPGVGKTRLMREIALRARLQDLRVVWWTPDAVSGEGLEASAPGALAATAAIDSRQTIDWALNWATALHAELGRHDWILLVDDLSEMPAWFVQSTMELCRATFTPESHRTLVLIASRASVLALQHEFQDAPREAVLRLQIGNWGPEGVDEALSALYGTRQIDPSLASLVHDATSGNPEVVEQFAQHLVENGSLRSTPTGQLTITEGTRSDAWRPTRTGWIDRALGRCGAAELQLLQCMCAFRPAVSTNLLAMITHTSEADLAGLVRAGLVQSVPGAGSPVYTPVGAVIRSTVLMALSPQERTHLHAEISNAISRGAQPADPEELAYHAALSAKMPALIPALEHLATLASPETLRRVHDVVALGLDANVDPVLRAQFTLLRLAALHHLGDVASSIALAGAELPTCPSSLQAAMRGYLAEAHYALGNASEALESIRSIGSTGNLEHAALAARCLWALERFEDGLAIADAMLASLTPSDVRRPALLETKIALLRSMGHVAEARTIVKEAVRTAVDLAWDREMAAHLLTWGNIEFYQGQFARADERFAKALDVLSRLGDRPGLLRALSHLAASAGESGRYVEAREYLLRAMDLSRSLGEFRTLSTLLCNSALLELVLARYAKAIQQVQSSLTLFKTVQNERAERGARVTEGQIHARLGSYTAARAAFDWVVQQHSESLPRAHGFLAFAALHLSQSAPALAVEALNQADPILEALGAEDEKLEALLLRARIAEAEGNLDAAITIADTVARSATSTNGFLAKVRADVLLCELVAAVEPNVAEQLAATGLITTVGHALPEETWRLHRVIGRCKVQLGNDLGGVTAYQRAWAIVEDIIGELPGDLASGYLHTPELARLISEIEALPPLHSRVE